MSRKAQYDFLDKLYPDYKKYILTIENTDNFPVPNKYILYEDEKEFKLSHTNMIVSNTNSGNSSNPANPPGSNNDNENDNENETGDNQTIVEEEKATITLKSSNLLNNSYLSERGCTFTFKLVSNTDWFLPSSQENCKFDAFSSFDKWLAFYGYDISFDKDSGGPGEYDITATVKPATLNDVSSTIKLVAYSKNKSNVNHRVAISNEFTFKQLGTNRANIFELYGWGDGNLAPWYGGAYEVLFVSYTSWKCVPISCNVSPQNGNAGAYVLRFTFSKTELEKDPHISGNIFGRVTFTSTDSRYSSILISRSANQSYKTESNDVYIRYDLRQIYLINGTGERTVNIDYNGNREDSLRLYLSSPTNIVSISKLDSKKYKLNFNGATANSEATIASDALDYRGHLQLIWYTHKVDSTINYSIYSNS